MIFDKKQNVVPALGSVSDNNSWGFCLGWQPAGSGCAGIRETWNGCPECFGGYDGLFVAPYDKIARYGLDESPKRTDGVPKEDKSD